MNRKRERSYERYHPYISSDRQRPYNKSSIVRIPLSVPISKKEKYGIVLPPKDLRAFIGKWEDNALEIGGWSLGKNNDIPNWASFRMLNLNKRSKTTVEEGDLSLSSFYPNVVKTFLKNKKNIEVLRSKYPDRQLYVMCVFYKHGDVQLMITETMLPNETIEQAVNRCGVEEILARFDSIEEVKSTVDYEDKVCFAHVIGSVTLDKNERIRRKYGVSLWSNDTEFERALSAKKSREYNARVTNFAGKKKVCVLCYAEFEEMKTIISDIRTRLNEGDMFDPYDEICGVGAVSLDDAITNLEKVMGVVSV